MCGKLLDSASFFKSLIKKASLLQSLVESKEVSSFSARDKVKVFERVLLRLQAMNSVDDYCDDFDYEELPDSFAELFCKAELSEDDSRSIYIPFETRCELGRYIAAYYPDVKLRIECMGQGVHHLLCMFALLNTQYIHLTQSNALSQTPNVEKGEFDIALALLQPTLNANKKNKNGDSDVKVEKLKGFFDKTRIDVDSFSSRYKEHGYIQHVLWSLKYDGKAYFYTGQGPLFRQYEKQARIHLIENNVVDVVVTLPEKLASFILPTMNLIILDKNKSTSQVKLIEGSSNFKVENAVNRLVNIDDFARAIGYQETQFLQVILVEAQQILLQDANLFFESYNVTENMSGTVEELEKHRRTLLTSFEKIQKSLTDSIFRLNDT